jgi:hypothetical protein
MSSDPPDANAYAFEYKTAVYDSLFVGIVYGKAITALSFFPCLGVMDCPFTTAGIYVILYVVSVHILL